MSFNKFVTRVGVTETCFSLASPDGVVARVTTVSKDFPSTAVVFSCNKMFLHKD